MEGSPGILHHSIEALDFDKDCGLFISASSLTNRYWVGALFYYKNAEDAPSTADGCCITKQLDASIGCLKSVKDTNSFVCGTDAGSVQLWKIDTSETPDDPSDTMMCMAEPVEHDDYVTSLSLNSSQSKVVSSSQDCQIKVWDMKGLTCTNTYKAHSDCVSMAAYHHTHPDVFVSCSKDGSMLLWDTRKPKPATVIENEFLSSAPTCLSWKPNSEHSIAIGTETGEVLLQDTRKGVGLPIINKLHNRSVHQLAFAPHRDDWLATASEDGKACVLQYDSDSEASIVDEVTSHTDFVRDVTWHPTNHKLYTCGWDSKVLATSIKSAAAENMPQQNGVNAAMKDMTDVNKTISKIEKMDVVVGTTNVEA